MRATASLLSLLYLWIVWIEIVMVAKASRRDYCACFATFHTTGFWPRGKASKS